MKAKKLLFSLLSVICLGTAAVGLTSCEESRTQSNNSNNSNVEYDPYYYTEGLEFSLLQSGDGYCVYIGTAINERNIIIPSIYKNKPVTTINPLAFKDCISLTSLTIPKSVTYIAYGALEGCSSLQKLTIPFVGIRMPVITDNEDLITERYASYQFFGVIFGSNSIAEQNYYVPDSLREVTITNATKIGNYAFSGCTSIKKIIFPDNVTSIGSSAFEGCGSFTRVTIPKSVEYIGLNAFKGCNALGIVYYAGRKYQWKKIHISDGNDNLTNSTIIYNCQSKNLILN